MPYAAPGGPGAPASWSTANKDAIGTAITETSRVWWSLAGGALTEVLYPSPDHAVVRALSLTVTGGDFHSDEVVDALHTTRFQHAVAPVVATTSECKVGRYRIEKETICDPHENVVLQSVRFVPTSAQAEKYRVFCVLEPHLGERGDAGAAELTNHGGRRFIAAHDKRDCAMVLMCTSPWLAATVGFNGTSDGRHDLRRLGHLASSYDLAADGTVLAVVELSLPPAGASFTLALGFGATPEAARDATVASLARGYERVRADLIDEWESWSAQLRHANLLGKPSPLWMRSASVLKTLEAKGRDGGRVAALSTPWGASKGPGIDGTYQLVWTRDLVEGATAMLATEAHDEVAGALRYLSHTQQPDGHWPQCMRLSGEPVWKHTELDEVALPVTLVDLARRRGRLTADELSSYWPMCRSAAVFLMRAGPSTRRDRWEDTSGLTPFSMAAAIAALLAAAEMAEHEDERALATRMRELADEWNTLIDTALYRRGGALAAHVGVDGYYVRAREPGGVLATDLVLDRLPKNEVSPDALALVRFGLRRGDDPRVLNTIAVIDATLKYELPGGPAWRRYTGDEYGEHDDGTPFDGHGIGRCWPLLTGERAHYELARGRLDRAESLLHSMEALASPTGMLPEQVWDAAPMPRRNLELGRATGSAAPLGWAHAEYLLLCRSLRDGALFDMPYWTRRRYVER